ncbi:MAG: hypothetical protein IJA36_00675 [Lachnospiraceae bacterium]|nr:hypothetical protein [Lachnospiraceae bacterium]
MNWFKNTKQPYKSEFIVTGLILLFFYLTYFYTDVAITTRSGIDFWTFLFNGQISDFYELSKDMTFYDTLHCDALYDFSIYIIFAIWDFPLWLAEKFWGIDALMSTPCLLWAKGIMLPFLAGSMIYLKKIGTELGFSKEKNNWCLLTYISSSFVISSIFVLCQYDIIGIFFSLIGLYYYIKGDLKKFTLFMAISITMKNFALLIFLPLILLKEKKIVKVVLYTIASMGIFILSQLLFTIIGATPAGSFLFAQVNKFLIGTIPVGLGNASLFIICYLAILLFCYMKNCSTEYELRRFSIYVPFVVWAAFLVFSETSPYWIILIAPYFTLMACQNTSILKLNLLLEGFAGAGLILAQNLFFPWVFSYKWLMALMPFSKIFHPIEKMVQENNLSILGDEKTLTTFTNTFGLPLTLALFAFSMISLVVLNFPWKKQIEEAAQNGVSDFSEELSVERSVVWFRFALGCGVCLVPFFFYFLDWMF